MIDISFYPYCWNRDSYALIVSDDYRITKELSIDVFKKIQEIRQDFFDQLIIPVSHGDDIPAFCHFFDDLPKSNVEFVIQLTLIMPDALWINGKPKLDPMIKRLMKIGSNTTIHQSRSIKNIISEPIQFRKALFHQCLIKKLRYNTLIGIYREKPSWWDGIENVNKMLVWAFD